VEELTARLRGGSALIDDVADLRAQFAVFVPILRPADRGNVIRAIVSRPGMHGYGLMLLSILTKICEYTCNVTFLILS